MLLQRVLVQERLAALRTRELLAHGIVHLRVLREVPQLLELLEANLTLVRERTLELVTRESDTVCEPLAARLARRVRRHGTVFEFIS